jgi:putative transposase
VPSRLKRFHHSQLPHFITFTCYRRRPHLAEIAIRELFITSLERTRVLYRMRVYGYVVMPDHVHLLVSEPERGTIANAVQSLKISSAKRWSQALGLEKLESALWQKRYYDRNVRDHDEFVEKLRYIHRNPVKRGLVAKPEDWKWSSFRHYACGEACGVEIESERTAAAP